MVLFDFFMNFIRGMLTFTQQVYDFALGGFKLAEKGFMGFLNFIDGVIPGRPNVFNLANQLLTSFGYVLFAIISLRLIMTVVNLLNPLS